MRIGAREKEIEREIERGVVQLDIEAEENKEGKFRLKAPKGTRDYPPEDAKLVERIIRKAEEIYRAHGGVPLDTPTFELKKILTNKYGEDEKLIYDLAQQGGEECSLRYDLTVSLARYMAETKTMKLKRYQTGKVFRRDQPVLSKGRYREFWQSDFDILGVYESMVPEAEILSVANSLLSIFSEGKAYRIRISHKGLVQAILRVSGVSVEMEKTIGSSIDKMDKLSWEEIEKEMVEKGISEKSARTIREYVSMRGDENVISRLKEMEVYALPGAKEAVKEMEVLFGYLAFYGIERMVEIDLSLVRGSDYYTGVIIEGGYLSGGQTVVAGGRYDNLVEDLEKLGSKKIQGVRAIGISLGVSRIFGLLEGERRAVPETEVLVCASGAELLEERMGLTSRLRRAGIKSEYVLTKKVSFARQAAYAESNGIPLLVVIGSRELERGCCQVMSRDKSKREVLLERLEEEVKEILVGERKGLKKGPF
jgi:histidyl-tRNA synthetase